MREKQQRMYSTMPNLVLAFHGCDKSTFDNIIRHGESMHISTNDYDWLGNGMYFWEQDLQRAWQWAEEAANNAKSKVKIPAVVGAVIDMGYCLNFLDNRSPVMLRQHNLRPFDTIRGLFQEGKPLYETSGFFEKTHIQICVRNPNCIKGFFAPRVIDENWNIV